MTGVKRENLCFYWSKIGVRANFLFFARIYIPEPLTKLLGKKVPFKWGEKEEESYRQIIKALESAGALHPYDISLELSGIASSLYMITEENKKAKWWPLDHLSRILTPAEEGYPQIWKVWHGHGGCSSSDTTF